MAATTSTHKCHQCANTVSGNDNKRFCSDKCKNDYHNARRKEETKDIGAIISILKTNRKIIADLLNGSDTKKVREQNLLDKGFVFRYHTHRRINKGDSREYIFCFDYGYLLVNPGWYTIVRAFKEDA